MDVQAKVVMKALKQGWTVSMNVEGELEFTKKHNRMSEKERKDTTESGYSKNFLAKLLQDQ